MASVASAPFGRSRPSRHVIGLAGVVFLVAGVTALLAPRLATLVVERAAAWPLVLCGRGDRLRLAPVRRSGLDRHRGGLRPRYCAGAGPPCAATSSARLPSRSRALAATAVSFAVIAWHDVVSGHGVVPDTVPVPVPVAAAAGFAGIAISNLPGFSYLTGTAVRCCIYTAFGLDLARVAQDLAISGVEFFLNAALVIGTLLLHPQGLAAQLPLGDTGQTALALVVLRGWRASRAGRGASRSGAGRSICRRRAPRPN